ncbi:MAG: MFS transporter, partial [Akkermansiaceae bacterium]
ILRNHFRFILSQEYRSTPTETTGMPGGIPYIIANEAAERFSFYGMKAALAIFLANYLGLLGGENLTQSQATSYVSYFNGAVYLTPLFGALIADTFFGKYRTIVTLSIVYCFGHLCLAFMGVGGMVQLWLLSGLGLIALGAGGIKPCVSAHVGDQFGISNEHLLPKIFNIFYFSINAGAVISNLMIPWVLKWHGPHWAFGIPGVLMALATLFFWMGRRKFIHVEAQGTPFLKEVFSKEGLLVMAKLALLFYIFVSMFWCLFDQTATTLVFQAEKMDLNLLGIEVLPSQIQAFNPLLILILIPLFTLVIYPKVGKLIKLTPLRKIGTGFFLMVVSFAVISWAQEAIDRGEKPTVAWQLLAYLIFTTAEILISIVCLEFAYTQAMPKMKSFIMSLFLLSVFVGNAMTGLINDYIRIPESAVESAHQQFAASQEKVSTFFSDHNNLPTELALTDSGPHGNPIVYQLLHAGSARLSSAGPDGELKTEDDLNIIITVKESKRDEEGTWLYEEKKRQVLSEETEEASPLSFNHVIGGGTKLEGADYFWFFTKLMAGVALLFIPFSLFYRERTYLQSSSKA